MQTDVGTQLLHSFETEIPVDAIDSCSLGQAGSIFAAACYELVPEVESRNSTESHKQKRRGGIQLSWVPSESEGASAYGKDTNSFSEASASTAGGLLPVNSWFPFDYGVLDLALFKGTVGDSAEDFDRESSVPGHCDGCCFAVAVGSDKNLHGYHVRCQSRDAMAAKKPSEDGRRPHMPASNMLSSVTMELRDALQASPPCEGRGSTLEQLQTSDSAIGVAMSVVNDPESLEPSTALKNGALAAWSLSDGTVCTTSLSTQAFLQNKPITLNWIHAWHAHAAEVWAVALDPRAENSLIMTGADDSVLKLWDLRTPLVTPVAHNSKEHQAGVTVITFDSKNDHHFWTGSYDENVRLWDKRQLRHPLHSVGACGGIWRLKFESGDHNQRRLLVAGMYGGGQVFDVDDKGHLTCLGTHRSHTSMVYGIAALQHATGARRSKMTAAYPKRRSVYISGSFYDKRVALWALN